MSASGSKAGSLQSLGVDIIKQYNGQEQVDLKVVVSIPGSWFGGTEAGSLTAAERKQSYEAQAVEYRAVHEFKGGGGAKKSKEKAIRFVCISDAMDDARASLTRASFGLPTSTHFRSTIHSG